MQIIQSRALILLTLLIGLTSEASQITKYHSKEFNQTLTFLAVPNTDMSEKKSKQYKKTILKTINNVNAFIPKNWIAPELTVQMTETFNNAYQISDYIFVPRKLSLYGLFKHPNKTLPVIKHEYGHDVFSEMLSTVSPEWKQNQKVIPKYMALKEQADKIEAAYKKIFSVYTIIRDDPSRKEDLKKLKQALLKLEAKYEKVSNKIENLMTHFDEKIQTITTSYNEFFADVVAVLGSQDQSTGEMDPKAISRALFFAGLYEINKKAFEQYEQDLEKYKNGKLKEKPKKPTSVKRRLHMNNFRDFSKKVRVKGWDREEVHIELNPVRYFFWKYYLDNPLIRRQRKKVLVHLTKAIVHEIKVRHSGREYRDSQEVNEQLINSIQKSFANF